MIVKKIVVGYVIQEFDTDIEEFVSNQFIASDDVEWEDENGVNLDPDNFVCLSDGTLPYLNFDMVQP